MTACGTSFSSSCPWWETGLLLWGSPAQSHDNNLYIQTGRKISPRQAISNTHTHTHTHTYTCTHVCMHMYALSHAHTHTHTHQKQPLQETYFLAAAFFQSFPTTSTVHWVRSGWGAWLVPISLTWNNKLTKSVTSSIMSNHPVVMF